MRATTSTPEPAGKPISTVIGLVGQSSAKAEAAERKNASEASRAFNMDVSGGTASWLLCWGNGGRNAMGYMTEERRLIQETARAFALKEVLPLANKLDPEKADMPRELIQKLADMGYFGIVIPEQYGGLGLGVFEYCLITEELARAWMSVASIIARGNGLIGSRAMNEEQKRRYLTRMAKGEFLGAFSMSEPGAGSDIANIS